MDLVLTKHVPYELQTPATEAEFKLDPGGILNQLSTMVDTGAADATCQLNPVSVDSSFRCTSPRF